MLSSFLSSFLFYIYFLFFFLSKISYVLCFLQHPPWGYETRVRRSSAEGVNLLPHWVFPSEVMNRTSPLSPGVNGALRAQCEGQGSKEKREVWHSLFLLSYCYSTSLPSASYIIFCFLQHPPRDYGTRLRGSLGWGVGFKKGLRQRQVGSRAWSSEVDCEG